MRPFNALLHLQLKYCERCGGLWLRPDGAATPYCPPCEQFMAELPSRPLRQQRKSAQHACASADMTLHAAAGGSAPAAGCGGCL